MIDVNGILRGMAGVILMVGFILVLISNFCSILDEKEKKKNKKKDGQSDSCS